VEPADHIADAVISGEPLGLDDGADPGVGAPGVDPGPDRVRDQQVRLSGAEEDFCTTVLNPEREPVFTAEIPGDAGCVLNENRDLHSTPR